jgi:hypothetical protein
MNGMVLQLGQTNFELMRIISTKIHGIIDYVMGLILIAAPWIFDFARDGAETWVPVILGVSTILYSLLTNYELGISGKISMKTHLAIDMASGIFLAVSPWLFGFSESVYLPHVILGLAEVGAVLLSKTQPEHFPGKTSSTRSATSHAV